MAKEIESLVITKKTVVAGDSKESLIKVKEAESLMKVKEAESLVVVIVMCRWIVIAMLGKITEAGTNDSFPSRVSAVWRLTTVITETTTHNNKAILLLLLLSMCGVTVARLRHSAISG